LPEALPAWIVEKKLITVEIIDHQKPVPPLTLFDRNAQGESDITSTPVYGTD